MKNCRHENFFASVEVNRFEDTGRFMADVKIECSVCKEPFRFLGVPVGLAWDRPMVSVLGTELRAPIEPGPSPPPSRVSFAMPPEETEH